MPKHPYIDIESHRDDIVSLGSIGGKIERIRKLRGFSRKKVGLRCGFPEISADVRIVQYEKNQKVPRKEAKEKLCSALNIEEDCLFDADMAHMNQACHALFDMEDFHGLHPVEVNGKYYLEFSGQNIYGQDITPVSHQNKFLKDWMNARKKYFPRPDDDEETKAEKRKEYDIWRYQYPLNDYLQKFEDLCNS